MNLETHGPWGPRIAGRRASFFIVDEPAYDPPLIEEEDEPDDRQLDLVEWAERACRGEVMESDPPYDD